MAFRWREIFALIFSSNPIVRIDVFLIASIVISYAKARGPPRKSNYSIQFSVFLVTAGFSHCAHIFTPILNALSTPDKDSRLSVISSRHHGKDLFAKLQICWLLLIFTYVNICILHIFILANPKKSQCNCIVLGCLKKTNLNWDFRWW